MPTEGTRSRKCIHSSRYFFIPLKVLRGDSKIDSRGDIVETNAKNESINKCGFSIVNINDSILSKIFLYSIIINIIEKSLYIITTYADD